jgi:hypothetical protein
MFKVKEFPFLGTRMNTDYQDIKSYKKPNICENLCPKFDGFVKSQIFPFSGFPPARE